MGSVRDARLRGPWIATVAGLLLLVAAPPLGAEEGGRYRCGAGCRVYYGNARQFEAPCEVSADRVYRQIPEYRRILEEGLTDRDVRYHFLLKRASERFLRAVKATARELGHDLVAERGTLEAVGDDTPAPPDRTAEVVARLE